MSHRLGIVPALGLVAAGLALAPLLIEGMVRAMPQYLPRDTRLSLDLFRAVISVVRTKQEDSELGVKFKPNSDVLVEGHPDYRYHVRTYLNFPDAGFRGNVAARPLVGTALGDSFTFGMGVEAEETWPEQLSKLAGKNFANLGVIAHGPPQYSRVLKRYGLSLQPTIVLYAIYLRNDLWDALQFVRWQQEGGPYEKRAFGKSRFLARHSRLYQLLLSPKKNIDILRATAHPGIKLVRPIVDLSPESLRLAWEEVRRAILSARELTRAEGAALVLLLVPDKRQVYRHLLSGPSGSEEVQYLDEGNRRVIRLCEEYGLRCLDLSSRFRERAVDGEQLHFRIDEHWNATGHRLAARTIYDYLVSQRLLDAGKQ